MVVQDALNQFKQFSLIPAAVVHGFLGLCGARRALTVSKNWNSLQALMKMVLATSEREMPSTNLPMDFNLPTRGV